MVATLLVRDEATALGREERETPTGEILKSRPSRRSVRHLGRDLEPWLRSASEMNREVSGSSETVRRV
jgi:hypothetical protein